MPEDRVYCAHGHAVLPGTDSCPTCGSDIQRYGMTEAERAAELRREEEEQGAEPEPLAPDIVRYVDEAFPPESREEVRGILLRYGTRTWHPEQDRVRRAMLRSARRNVQALRRAFVCANADYRDLLWHCDPDNTRGPLRTDD